MNATDEERERRSRALSAINRYMLAEQSIEGGCSRAEFEAVNKTKRECVAALAEINEPLVQAIATKLTIARYSHNARRLIAQLADEVSQ